MIERQLAENLTGQLTSPLVVVSRSRESVAGPFSNIVSFVATNASRVESDRYEQMFWADKLGLIVTLPPSSTQNVAEAIAEGGSLVECEARRLMVINSDPILRKRYPTSEEGVRFMDSVDYVWRERLYEVAQGAANVIAKEAIKMGLYTFTPDGRLVADVAVILFGSVAKSLTKSPDHWDPSNIDLAVISGRDLTKEQKEELLDRIRGVRKSGEKEIGNNIGVSIHTSQQQFRNDGFAVALNYIGSSARALYDPKGIWQAIEEEALDCCKAMKRYNKNTNGKHNTSSEKVGSGMQDIVRIEPGIAYRQTRLSF